MVTTRNILGKALLIFSVGTPYTLQAAPQQIKFTRNQKTFELTAEARKGDGPYGLEITYSVKVGAKKLKNWESQSRFVLKTCSEHGIPKQFTDIVNDGKENIGFLVFSGCGNPFRGDYDFVRINDKWPELEIVSKISKSKPVFRATDNPNIVEMWTVDQRFPNGVGTSLSFFVPIVYKFSRSGDGLSHEDRRPPEKIASWPIFEYAFDFRSYFASGLMMMDDRVLSQAVDLYFDSQKAVGYRELGLPASKEDAAKVISAVKTLSEYYDNYPMPCRH